MATNNASTWQVRADFKGDSHLTNVVQKTLDPIPRRLWHSRGTSRRVDVVAGLLQDNIRFGCSFHSLRSDRTYGGYYLDRIRR